MAELGAEPMSQVFFVADAFYAHPSRAWVRGAFASALKTLLDGLEASVWTDSSNDCDDFARLSAAFASCLHNRTVGHERNTGLALGEFWYVRDAGGGHAINMAIVYQDGKPELMFFEPQTQQEVKLTEREVLSCVAYRF